jgi:uncharacterized protein YhfF
MDQLDVAAFWAAFCEARGIVQVGDAKVTFFGDGPAQQDALCALVMAGRKRATASLACWYGPGRAMPAVGDFFVVVDGGGRARGVIELVTVEERRFCDVDAAFAAEEGEGDGSLAYWVAEHRRFFEAELAREGLAFAVTARVVCERFRLVWAPA